MGSNTIKIDAQPILVSDIPRAVKRVMDRYDYTYFQCCEMPLILLKFLHDNAKAEEENPRLLRGVRNE